jgi:hypothetical protein
VCRLREHLGVVPINGGARRGDALRRRRLEAADELHDDRRLTAWTAGAATIGCTASRSASVSTMAPTSPGPTSGLAAPRRLLG